MIVELACIYPTASAFFFERNDANVSCSRTKIRERFSPSVKKNFGEFSLMLRGNFDESPSHIDYSYQCYLYLCGYICRYD